MSGAAYRSVALTENSAVRIIDQNRLPGELIYKDLYRRQEMYDAIRTLQVRGAPALGVFGACCVYVLSRTYAGSSYGDEDFFARLDADCAYLISCRPTAADLARQIRRMQKLAHTMERPDGRNMRTRSDIIDALRKEAEAVCDEVAAMCLAIAQAGLGLLHQGDTVLTHCNAGPLATAGCGTGLGPVLLAAERGMDIKAYVDETRPLLQGARLTAWELQRAGVDCTLICDSMAAAAMAQGRIQAVLAGCDRLAANGDAANKIGTLSAAVAAKHYGVPVYILLPSSSIDMACPTGADIPIEERDGEEIRSLWYEKPMAPEGVRCWDPAFDVTDHTLITAIVTEKGVVYPPFDVNLKKLFG